MTRAALFEGALGYGNPANAKDFEIVRNIFKTPMTLVFKDKMSI